MKPYVVLAVFLTAVAGTAAAQNVYRSGKNNFSDQAPTASTAPSAVGSSISTVGNGSQLPYELRQVVQRYPVTLYSAEDCGACGAGRSLLITRGIPFDERTIKSNDDVAALQRLSGQTGLPLLAIGSQQLKGFSDAEWTQYLDAAGYPASVRLPAGYRNPPAQPLVALQPAPAPAAAATPTAAAPAAGDSDTGAGAETPSNPAGIKF